MEEYLITARSVTQAQRMAQLLERRGVRAVIAQADHGHGDGVTGRERPQLGDRLPLAGRGGQVEGAVPADHLGSAAAAGGGLCTRAGICSSG